MNPKKFAVRDADRRNTPAAKNTCQQNIQPSLQKLKQPSTWISVLKNTLPQKHCSGKTPTNKKQQHGQTPADASLQKHQPSKTPARKNPCPQKTPANKFASAETTRPIYIRTFARQNSSAKILQRQKRSLQKHQLTKRQKSRQTNTTAFNKPRSKEKKRRKKRSSQKHRERRRQQAKTPTQKIEFENERPQTRTPTHKRVCTGRHDPWKTPARNITSV